MPRKRRRKKRRSKRRKFRLTLNRKQKHALKVAGWIAGGLAILFLAYTFPQKAKGDLLRSAKAMYSRLETHAREKTLPAGKKFPGPVRTSSEMRRPLSFPSIPAAPASRAREDVPAVRSLPSAAKVSPERVPLPVSGSPKISIVIDDIGNTMDQLLLLKQLGDRVTYAIMPSLPHSRDFDALSKVTGAEVILHLPMECRDEKYPGPGFITTRMPDSQVAYTLERDLESVPHRVGVNNHMGSLGTEDPVLMERIFRELKRRNYFFLDSYTTDRSVAVSLGRAMLIPVLRRNLFLDNADEKPAIREKLRELARMAREKGFAIGIGHYRPRTLEVLAEEIPALERAGYRFVRLSELARGEEGRATL